MKYEIFENLMNTNQKINSKIASLYDVGVDLYESIYAVSDDVYQLFEQSMLIAYTQDGVDLISWFIHENQYGKRNWNLYKDFAEGIEDIVGTPREHGATDENGNPICYDLPSLHEFLEMNYKRK